MHSGRCGEKDQVHFMFPHFLFPVCNGRHCEQVQTNLRAPTAFDRGFRLVYDLKLSEDIHRKCERVLSHGEILNS